MPKRSCRWRSAATTSARARCSSPRRIRSRPKAPTCSSARRSISSTRRSSDRTRPIPSMQLAIENVDQAGGCAYGYACVYTDTISWADAETPLPMIRDPRYAFDQLFGVGATPQERAARRAHRQEHPRLDDHRGVAPAQHAGAERSRPARELSRRHQRDRAPHQARRSAEQQRRARASCPARPRACPTRSPST